MLSVEGNDRVAEDHVEEQRYQGWNEDGLSARSAGNGDTCSRVCCLEKVPREAHLPARMVSDAVGSQTTTFASEQIKTMKRT